MPSPRTGRLRQLARGIRVLCLVGKGVVLVAAVFPSLRVRERDAFIGGWCQDMLEVLSIGISLGGETPPPHISSVLFVANHVSWIDVLVMNAFRRVHFVAKSEVRGWPVVGWLAARTGTLFLKRSSTRELAPLTKSVTRLLRHGHCVALFPEGTTTEGTGVKPFHSGLFEAAIRAESLIWPIAIQYRRQDGVLDSDLAFLGEQSLVASIMNVLSRSTTLATLSFIPPIASGRGNRRELAAWSQSTIEQTLIGHPLGNLPASALCMEKDGTLPPASAA